MHTKYAHNVHTKTTHTDYTLKHTHKVNTESKHTHTYRHNHTNTLMHMHKHKQNTKYTNTK